MIRAMTAESEDTQTNVTVYILNCECNSTFCTGYNYKPWILQDLFVQELLFEKHFNRTYP